MRIKTVFAVVAMCAAVIAGPAGSGAEISGCAPAAPGGEWRSYGHDLSNTRTQDLESAIGPDNAASLAPAWALDVAADLGATGSFQSTPVIADGCIYLATDTGWVFSLNAATGDLNWKRQLEGGLFGLTVTDDQRIIALVNRTNNPYATSLDQITGVPQWSTPVPQTRQGLRTNASAVVWNDVVFMGYSVVEGDVAGHAGWQVLALEDGERLAHDYVIPEEDWQYGYGGGGVWTTGVVDDGFVFVGTSNPTSKKIEHPHHNAVLKIDLRRTLSDGSDNPNIGRIVDSNKGNFDQYYPGLDRQPACEMTGDQLTYLGFSITCVQLDLDFGASPNLFTDREGNTLMGILQKSGVYHAYYADTLHLAWTQVLAAPCLQCNFATTAVAGDTIFGVGTPPGQMVAFDVHRGAYRWAALVGDGLHHQAVSTANGVVYVVDSLGNLNAYDAETGLQLLKRPMSLDTGGSNVALSSSGIAIARNTIYAPAGNDLVAYRLPA